MNAVRRTENALHRLRLAGNDLARFADRRAKDLPDHEAEAMTVAPDHRQNRQSSDEFGVEDLPTGKPFSTELLGRRYLTETAREPRKFLPPPRVRSRRQAPPPREPESRLSKMAKLAGLTTAGTLLVGAVVASSMVTRERTEQTGRAVPTPPAITGAAALGGFAMQGSSSADRHEPSAVVTTPAKSPATRSHPAQPTPPSTFVPEPSEGSSASSAPSTDQTSAAEKLATVREFYQRMGSQHPQDALDMLAPDLVGDQPGELVRAWSTMSRIDVKEVHVRPDGSVQAVVDMLRKDGSLLRVTQVLHLAKDVIEQAELLSADLM